MPLPRLPDLILVSFLLVSFILVRKKKTEMKIIYLFFRFQIFLEFGLRQTYGFKIGIIP